VVVVTVKDTLWMNAVPSVHKICSTNWDHIYVPTQATHSTADEDNNHKARGPRPVYNGTGTGHGHRGLSGQHDGPHPTIGHLHVNCCVDPVLPYPEQSL
jgi:hypothetical protein